MDTSDELVLRFERFPGVNNRAQRDIDGRLWRIIRIEAPYCWAAPHGTDAPFVRYRLEVTRRSGARDQLVLATTEQRRLYRKMRVCGLDRATALAEVYRPPDRPQLTVVERNL
jgi:hypothetical protein